MRKRIYICIIISGTTSIPLLNFEVINMARSSSILFLWSTSTPYWPPQKLINVLLLCLQRKIFSWFICSNKKFNKHPIGLRNEPSVLFSITTGFNRLGHCTKLQFQQTRLCYFLASINEYYFQLVNINIYELSMLLLLYYDNIYCWNLQLSLKARFICLIHMYYSMTKTRC